MPIKFIDDQSKPSDAPTSNTPEPSEPNSGFGSLRNWLAGGVRMGAGLLSGEGMLPGALISGGGEAIAEAIEGSPFSLPRIGVEAGLGAIPLSKVFRVGKVASTAIRSGALGAVGEAGREAAKGEDLSIPRIATTGVISGATGGALSKVLGMLPSKVAAKAGEKAAEELEVVPTAQTGQGTQVVKPSPGMKKGGVVPSTKPSGKMYEAPGTLPKQRVSTEIPYKAPTKLESEVQDLSGVPIRGAEGVPSQPAPYRSAAKAAVRAEEKTAQEVAKANKEASDLAEVQRIREENGLTNKNVSSSDTFAAPGEEGGTSRATISYTKPKPDPVQDLAGGVVEPKAPVSTPPTPPVEAVTSPAPQAPPETPLGKVLGATRKTRSKKTPEGFQSQVDKILGTEPTPQAPAPPAAPVEAVKPGATLVGEPINSNPLKDLFKAPTGMTGLNYRMAKEAFERGEITADQLSKIRQVHVDELAKGKPPVVQVPTVEPKDPNAWIQEQSDLLDKMKGQRGGGITPPKNPNERGAIDPTLLKALTGLTGAAIGAPLGAASQEDDNKLTGALVGAGLGAGVGAGVPGAIGAFQGGLTHMGAGKLIPAVQRANLLTSKHGLPANAVFGPWGSGVMGAIEHGLSGDQRGWDALQHLKPSEMLNPATLKENFNEAAGLIGRAEGTALDKAATPLEKVLAVPGTAMTTGDLTARQALEKAGFLPEETREITMTNEPWTNPSKKLANVSKGSPLLQFMFPFSRTTANIAEQGAKRIPGIGMFVNKAMEEAGRAPDTLRTKLVQQGMGGAVMAGSGALGAIAPDPETAKIWKKYLSNAAGQYSLPASIGFMAGQALGNDKNPIRSGLNELADALPLPSARPLQDLGTMGGDLYDVLKGNRNLTDTRIPHGAYPAIFRELGDTSLPSFGGADESQLESPVSPDQPDEVIRIRR